MSSGVRDRLSNPPQITVSAAPTLMSLKPKPTAVIPEQHARSTASDGVSFGSCESSTAWRAGVNVALPIMPTPK
jgi:hypothetical protein